MLEQLETERLILRPLRPGDARPLAEIADNWNIARMLARLPHPYELSDAEEWIALQPERRASGTEFCYGVTLDGVLIGSCGALNLDDGSYELGYWIGEPWWNRGYATEAARAVIAQTAETFGPDRIVAGHFADNHASGRVLTKLGFRYTGEEKRWSLARNEHVHTLRMVLKQEAKAGRNAA